MKANFQRLLVLLIFACLSRPVSEVSFGQSSTSSEAPKKRVFKNEDLDKYQEKYGSETSPASKPGLPVTSPANKASSPEQDNKGKPKQALTIWRAKLKEIDDSIASKKTMEVKLTGSLGKYSKNLAEADTDFQKSTAQLQVAGVQENLTRTQAELKKAEEDKAKLISDAKKAGIQEEDLLNSESHGEAKK
jgi:hypothetical protein